MSPDEDARLSEQLRAALDGDEKAYADFLSRVARMLRSAVRRRLGSASGIEAEDIVQEALLAIHLKRHTWRAGSPVGPWIYAIARYKTADAFRSRGKPAIDIALLEETLQASEAETVQGRDIDRALDGLPPGQRKVVAAMGVEGCSISETAQALGMKENAVRVALHRGLAAIAARLGRNPD